MSVVLRYIDTPALILLVFLGIGFMIFEAPDALPFIGPTPLEGLYVAVGFSNHGFQISPAVGMLVANDILKGPEPMLASFRPDRGLAMSTTEIAAFRDEPVNV